MWLKTLMNRGFTMIQPQFNFLTNPRSFAFIRGHFSPCSPWFFWFRLVRLRKDVSESSPEPEGHRARVTGGTQKHLERRRSGAYRRARTTIHQGSSTTSMRSGSGSQSFPGNPLCKAWLAPHRTPIVPVPEQTVQSLRRWHVTVGRIPGATSPRRHCSRERAHFLQSIAAAER